MSHFDVWLCLAQSLVDSLNGACRICLEPADVGDYQAWFGLAHDADVGIRVITMDHIIFAV